MQWASDLWEWFIDSVRSDAPGWIAVAFLLAGAIVAFIRRRRIGDWVRAYFAKRQQAARFRTAESTVNVMFDELLSHPRADRDWLETRQGGTIRYTIINLGPSPVDHVRVETLSPLLGTPTPLYWPRLLMGQSEQFVIIIPFGADHDVMVRWAQSKHVFERRRTLPFGAAGGGV